MSAASAKYTSMELVPRANIQAMTALSVSTVAWSYTRHDCHADNVPNSIWQVRSQLPYGEQSYNSRCKGSEPG